MNTRTMRGPRRVDTSWPQTAQFDPPPIIRTRPLKKQRPLRFTALDASIWLGVAITIAALAYKCTGPA